MAAAASKRAAAEELRLVDSKLGEVERQLGRLKEERAMLLERKRNLTETLEARDVAADVDWGKPEHFPWSGDVQRLKQEVFRIDAPWRPNQLEIINATLSNVDTFVVMCTGGGKSLTFQIPALLPDKGVTLVVSPLLSLISDQVFGMDAIAPGTSAMLVGTMSREESSAVMRRMKDPNDTLRLVYVTPEKIVQSKLLQTVLEKLNDAGRLERFAIDEAHCVALQSHDFRPLYQQLSILRRLFPQVPILAVTATCTPAVLREVKDVLQMRNVELFKSPFNRPNLVYRIQPKPASMDEAVRAVFRFIQRHHPGGQSGIVYCFSQKESETVAAQLASLGNLTTGIYHAGIDPAVKDRLLKQWTAGKIQICVCTIAFGMGINKPNVRFVIHFSLSKSLEGYVQEAGRAGRDGQVSSCLLLYRASDAVRQASLILNERTGLQKLRTMVEFAQLSGRECRRLPISRALGETLDPREACRGHCDVCSGEVQKVQMDATAAALGMVQLLRGLAAKEKRVTHRQLAELWQKEARRTKRASKSKKRKGGGGATHGEEEEEEDSAVDMLVNDKDAVELLIQQLVYEHVLAEDYHASLYSVNAYTVVGYRASDIERGQARVWMEVDGEGGGGGGGEGVVETKAKRKKAPEKATVVEILSSDSETEEDEQQQQNDTGLQWENDDDEDDEVEVVEDGKKLAGVAMGKQKKEEEEEEEEEDDEEDEFDFGE